MKNETSNRQDHKEDDDEVVQQNLIRTFKIITKFQTSTEIEIRVYQGSKEFGNQLIPFLHELEHLYYHQNALYFSSPWCLNYLNICINKLNDGQYLSCADLQKNRKVHLKSFALSLRTFSFFLFRCWFLSFWSFQKPVSWANRLFIGRCFCRVCVVGASRVAVTVISICLRSREWWLLLASCPTPL